MMAMTLLGQGVRIALDGTIDIVDWPSTIPPAAQYVEVYDESAVPRRWRKTDAVIGERRLVNLYVEVQL